MWNLSFTFTCNPHIIHWKWLLKFDWTFVIIWSYEDFYFIIFYRLVKPGTLLIDSSTIDPSVSKDLSIMAEKRGAVFLDAPVSGGKWTIGIFFLKETFDDCNVRFFCLNILIRCKCCQKCFLNFYGWRKRIWIWSR